MYWGKEHVHTISLHGLSQRQVGDPEFTGCCLFNSVWTAHLELVSCKFTNCQLSIWKATTSFLCVSVGFKLVQAFGKCWENELQWEQRFSSGEDSEGCHYHFSSVNKDSPRTYKGPQIMMEDWTPDSHSYPTHKHPCKEF